MTPDLLLRRLDDLGRHLSTRPDAIALLGLGSVGAEIDRVDEYSDLDFFVIVADGAKPRYLESIDWLAAPAPVAYSFANSVDGRKALYQDGVFVEYAVFTVAELAQAGYAPGRIVWQRADAPAGLANPRPQPPSPHATVAYHLNEALTNLYVGLKREARGERLSALRFIQQYAIDRILTICALRDPSRRWDPFDPARRAETNIPAGELPLAAMMPGYHGNRAAAEAILDWLEARFAVDPVIAAAIRAQLTAG